jgi:DNA-directed RNA polymerase specialized sigma24 family protein
VLRCIEELDYREIADVLDCPVQTVRANLHLARKQVRRALGEAL